MSAPALHAPARPLQAAMRGVAELPPDLAVTDLTLDSREVTAGAAFFACRGARSHGLEFAARAAAAGARAVLWESAPGVAAPGLPAHVLVVEVPQLRAHLGLIADRFFGAPSAHLAIAGITGTNGKSTCAWLLAEALALLGRRSAYIGTLGVGSARRDSASAVAVALRPLSNTTPDVLSVHRLLAQLVEGGSDSVAMEISSHALDQGRCAGVRLRGAAFTNLTRDHLDYHGTMDAYAAAKARLFDWPQLGARVINIDDAFGRALAQRLQVQPGEAPLFVTARDVATVRAAAYGASAAGRRTVEYVGAERVSITPQGLLLAVASSRGSATLASPLRGAFNADNLLTVLALLLAWEIPLPRACEVLGACAAPPGRMQAEGGGTRPLVLIDYAHTPDGLAKALAAARLYCAGRLWCVFGCGGERDQGKRADMGRIAADLADALIITDDNPRGEDPAAIANAIAEGAAAAGAERRMRIVHDRALAIRRALAEAAAQDVIVVAGKGHEEYQLIAGQRRAFSDVQAVRAALAMRGAA
ncbi:MAG TPA: UDP-N-acetylmuramoyl-L-alanyl-D-glutamate--2,6-diaminopimelate ligase [Steroidobacteraceae bacterium]|jgi:UDP-N-acetylmuramoyl-L-alanyl-D-glutamate--2,6-diaminopimelate ligase|nr:UDP-N-acetylmuramoyl-L-alanyl-D-glutamate--2,6-diaminopimelate ligase [Steroidobacteraceae bacterium]